MWCFWCSSVKVHLLIVNIISNELIKVLLPSSSFISHSCSFQTQSGVFCINWRAPWVRAKIVAFEWVLHHLPLTHMLSSTFQMWSVLIYCYFLLIFSQESKSSAYDCVWGLLIEDDWWWNLFRDAGRSKYTNTQNMIEGCFCHVLLFSINYQLL